MNTNEVINGKRYWIGENGANAIWYNNELSNDLWIVGDKNYVGTLTGSIHTISTNQCPNDQVDTWRYFSIDVDEWVDGGSNIQLKCVIQDTACGCSTYGSSSSSCTSSGICTCKPNVIGAKCTACMSGFYGFPNCQGNKINNCVIWSLSELKSQTIILL